MSIPINDVIAERLRAYRKARDLTMDQLADRCRGVLTASAIGNLERPASPSRPRRSVTVTELMVLADALGVPPGLLMFDVGDSDQVEIIPGYVVSHWDALRWVSGEATLTGESIKNNPDYALTVLFREHRDLTDLLTQVGVVPSPWQKRHMPLRAERLVELRTTIRQLGKNPPDVPAEALAVVEEIAPHLLSSLGSEVTDG